MQLRVQAHRGPAAASSRLLPAAVFLLGVSLPILLLVAMQHHSEAHARMEGRRSLPGQLEDEANGGSGNVSAVEATAAQSATEVKPVPLPDLDSVPALMVSFGNAAYFELAHNWAKSVQAIGSAPFLIAAFDDAMLGLCARTGLPCVRVHLPGYNDSNFRGDFKAFRLMGAVKVQFVAELLEKHPNLPLVMVSDTDAVWLRQPWSYFEQRPRAEFFISTDCLSITVEDEWKPAHGAPRCGHVPNNGGGRAFNTGMFAARNTNASRAFMRAWADMLTDPNKEHHTDPAHRGIDDQMALNLLFEEGGVTGVKDDPRVILVYNRTLRVQPLPVSLFSNGHVAFVQRTPWERGITPMVIHATFQRFAGAGKKCRLREFGLWHMDPPDYYGANEDGSIIGGGSVSNGKVAAATRSAGGAGPRGQPLRLLTWQNDVLEFVEAQEAERYGGKGHGMPLNEKNWVGLSYQLQAMRDAAAAAQMLGRVVVLPQLWCWCDYDEHPLILESCKIRGTDIELPFKCPLDYLLPVPNLDSSGLQYRPNGFLDLPQVPAALKWSRSVLVIKDKKPENPFPLAAHTAGHDVALWPGIRQGELVRVAEPVAESAVLVLSGRVPGFLGGFDEAGQDQAFDALFGKAVLDWSMTPFWCCMTWGDTGKEQRRLHYAMPRPLADSWQPWAAPQMQVPPWCDDIPEKDGNRGFSLLPQHPCAFLRNATAAKLAAEGRPSRRRRLL